MGHATTLAWSPKEIRLSVRQVGNEVELAQSKLDGRGGEGVENGAALAPPESVSARRSGPEQ